MQILICPPPPPLKVQHVCQFPPREQEISTLARHSVTGGRNHVHFLIYDLALRSGIIRGMKFEGLKCPIQPRLCHAVHRSQLTSRRWHKLIVSAVTSRRSVGRRPIGLYCSLKCCFLSHSPMQLRAAVLSGMQLAS
jgi:hypothetical protein